MPQHSARMELCAGRRSSARAAGSKVDRWSSKQTAARVSALQRQTWAVTHCHGSSASARRLVQQARQVQAAAEGRLSILRCSRRHERRHGIMCAPDDGRVSSRGATAESGNTVNANASRRPCAAPNAVRPCVRIFCQGAMRSVPRAAFCGSRRRGRAVLAAEWTVWRRVRRRIILAPQPLAADHPREATLALRTSAHASSRGLGQGAALWAAPAAAAQHTRACRLVFAVAARRCASPSRWIRPAAWHREAERATPHTRGRQGLHSAAI